MSQQDRTYALRLWCVRLRSAYRTILACTIVYVATLYSPQPLKQLLAYPAYSYLTTVLIVSDATLGEALKGFFQALYACVLVLSLSIPSLWLIGPAHFSYPIAASAVATCTFVVALLGVKLLMAKRIAFGQIVIVYVGAAINVHVSDDELDGVVMHPIRVALSTMLGASASVLAMLFPNLLFCHKASLTAVLSPYLAIHEVRHMCQKYADNASERLDLYLKAILSHDFAALDSLQAQHLAKVGEKLLRSIKHKQEALKWESPKIGILKPSCMDVVEKFEDIEIPLRGMEMALTSCPSIAVSIVKRVPADALSKIITKLKQLQRSAPFYMTKRKGNSLEESFWTLETIFHEDLSAFFFVGCLKLLQENTEAIEECKQDYSELESSSGSQNHSSSGSQNQSNWRIKRGWSTSLYIIPSKKILIFASKCTLSLGLAVLFGLMYNKKEAYWAGLTIAISFVNERQATFTIANARAQSTAMGSIYGILCLFIFHKFEDLSFLPLLPWLIFTSFLRHSRMYGQAGGISAAVGALLILGRKNYGPPIDFAIARITEAVIGLICFLTIEILSYPLIRFLPIEILSYPVRAATQAKLELSLGLGTLQVCIKDMVQQCIKDMVLVDNQRNLQAARQNHKKLTSHVNRLEKFIGEAEMEPNFWFIPFNGACYGKLLRSLSKMRDLSLFMSNKLESLSQLLQRFKNASQELQKSIKGIESDLNHFKKKACSSLQCLQEVSSKKSLAVHDIELGTTSPRVNECRGTLDPEEAESILTSFLQHSNEVSDSVGTSNEGELKGQVVICLGGLGFCISNLLREIKEMQKEFQELAKWENPSSHVVV